MKLFGLFLGLILVISTSANLTVRKPRSVMESFFGTAKDCVCENFSCKCCGSVDFLSFNADSCVNLKVLEKDLGLQVSVTLNDEVIAERHVSTRDPPPVCLDNSALNSVANVCLRLYDVTYNNTHVHGCLKIDGFSFFYRDVEIGCLDIPTEKVNSLPF